MAHIDRWIEITEYLKIKKFATAEATMEQFNVSRSTLRHTLIEMESKSLLKRVRGGAEVVDDKDGELPICIGDIFSNKKRRKNCYCKKIC